jgi:hypothetical protein
MAMRHRVVEELRSDEARGVRDVCKENGSYAVCYLAEASVIPIPCISGSTADDHFGVFTFRYFSDDVHVNDSCLFFNTIENRIVEFSREVYGRTVS